MATPLKDLYSPEFYQCFAKNIKKVIPDFSETQFIKQIFTADWEQKELKSRLYHSSITLHNFLPQPFSKAAAAILAIVEELKTDGINHAALEYMFLPDYVERYGMNDYKISLNTLRDLTEYTSSEFGIRPFIKADLQRTIAIMLEWSNDENEHIRRLASEGCRPRLPWAIALPALKADPNPILPLLENLKDDPSEYVRRSVANNLNDISKDHPDLILEIAKRWLGYSKERDKLVKHACRTLLKAGNAQAMQLFGYAAPDAIEIADFQLDTKVLDLGERIEMSFQLTNKSNAAVAIRLEYGIYFLLASGKQSKKVFKISEKVYAPKLVVTVAKKHHFKPITTRKFYAGEHAISIIVNGVEMVKRVFDLKLI